MFVFSELNSWRVWSCNAQTTLSNCPTLLSQQLSIILPLANHLATDQELPAVYLTVQQLYRCELRARWKKKKGKEKKGSGKWEEGKGKTELGRRKGEEGKGRGGE